MEIKELELKGVFEISPKVFEDKVRGGFFLESYKKDAFKAAGIDVEFIQDNHSQSTKGVLRGLHFQKPPFTQDKLCRVVRGEVLDVFVDLRKDSPTFGKSGSILLSEANKKEIFVPQGFAHGFLVLSDIADFEYKITALYSPENESGLLWNDSDLGIDWGIDNPIVNDRDAKLPKLKDLTSPF